MKAKGFKLGYFMARLNLISLKAISICDLRLL
jgi:hypothetical protein